MIPRFFRLRNEKVRGGVGDFEQDGKQPNPQIRQFSKKYL